MNTADQIQINYEDQSLMLSESIEQLIRTNLSKLLNKTNNGDRAISLFFCSLETMKMLNQTYRAVEKPTDILSWSYDLEDMIPGEDVWGELAICCDICQQQASDSGWPLETELLRLLVHGLGHLMGYDHETSEDDERRMLEMEKSLLASIDLDGLYG